MGFAAMLRQHGILAPRIVSALGAVSVGGGGGLRVEPHTFHGGNDPVDGGSAGAGWWTAPGGLDRERASMSKYFPGFVEMPGDGSGPPVWSGPVNTGRGTFRVAIVHRADHGLPAVIPLKRDLGRSSKGLRVRPPHLYLSGALCIASESDWDASKHDASTVLAWTAHWFACYVEWVLTGQWPSEGISDVAA